MFLLAFKLALLASTHLVDFGPEDASGSIVAGVETAVNLAGGFSAVARTCGCDCARSSTLPLLLTALPGLFTVAVVVAGELFPCTLSEDWRRYHPPAPISNRPPAAIAPIK